MLPVYFLCGWLRDPPMCYPPYTPVRRPFTVLPPYTVHGISAAYFGAMGVGFLCNPLLCYPPLHCT